MALPNQDALFNQLDPMKSKRPDGIAGPDLGGIQAPPMLADAGGQSMGRDYETQQREAAQGGGIINAPAAPSPSPMAAGPMPTGALPQDIGGGQPSPPPIAAAPAQKFALGGWDAGKLASGHDSPKYQIGRVLEQFDPKAGLGQAGLMDKLNTLGIGQFSSDGGDGMRVANGDPRFEGMNAWDAIQGSKGGDAGWQFGVDNNLEAAQGPQAGGGGRTPMTVGGNIDPLLSGDPLAKIMAALGQHGGGRSNADALFGQLGA
jgi:hypothetical protein